MKTYTVYSVTYTPGPYGPIAHQQGRRTMSEEQLRSIARNFNSVESRPGAGHVCLDRDNGIIFQVGGYSNSRGMFADVLPREELAPFLSE